MPAPERQEFGFPKVFAELSASAMLHPVRSVVEEWEPDVVVHDAAELTAPLAAAAARIPSVCHGYGEVVPEAAMRAAGEVMGPLWQDAGLEADAYAGSYPGCTSTSTRPRSGVRTWLTCLESSHLAPPTLSRRRATRSM